MVATHGAAHNQEFEIECLVPKLDIQVFGTGGSRRAGEQAAAKLALEAVQSALVKSPAAARKARPRTAQLKLAGIATVQATHSAGDNGKPVTKNRGDNKHGVSHERDVATPDAKDAASSAAAPDERQQSLITSSSQRDGTVEAAADVSTSTSSQTKIA